MFKIKISPWFDWHTNTTMLVIKYWTNATTGIYLHQKIKNVSPGPILEVKKSALIKDWKVLLQIKLLHKTRRGVDKQLWFKKQLGDLEGQHQGNFTFFTLNWYQYSPCTWHIRIFFKNFNNEVIILFLKIGIHSVQGWTPTARHGVTRKRNTKRLRHTGNLFRKNLQLKDFC